MAECSNDKDAAEACFKSIGLDEDLFRCGHTKASITELIQFMSPDINMIPRVLYPHTCIYRLHVLNLCYKMLKILNSSPHVPHEVDIAMIS